MFVKNKLINVEASVNQYASSDNSHRRVGPYLHINRVFVNFVTKIFLDNCNSVRAFYITIIRELRDSVAC